MARAHRAGAQRMNTASGNFSQAELDKFKGVVDRTGVRMES